MTENENAQLIWNYGIRTGRVKSAHRQDLALIDKMNNKVSLIDVAAPWDSIAEQKEQKKKKKREILRPKK